MKRYKLFLAALLIVLTLPLNARFYQPISDSQFYKYIEEHHNLAIAFFIPYAHKSKDINKIEAMQEVFRDVSREDRYLDADVAFIEINLDEIPDLVGDLRLNIEKPTLMLFKEGQIVRVNGKIFKQIGYFTKLEIEDLIKKYFGKNVDKRLKSKMQEGKTLKKII